MSMIPDIGKTAQQSFLTHGVIRLARQVYLSHCTFISSSIFRKW
jgi:hypothetical protein